MTVGSEQLLGLMDDLMSTLSEKRELSAETVSDWVPVFNEVEARTVVRLLALLASVEQEERVREAQLHAILELSSRFVVNDDSLSLLHRLGSANLNDEQLGYLDELGIVLDRES